MRALRKVDGDAYNIPMRGQPGVHRNLEWWASDDDRVLGTVILDLIDKDYSWVVFTQNDQGPGYTAVDVGHSHPTQENAIFTLHYTMWSTP